MAFSTMKSESVGSCYIDFELNKIHYSNVRVGILNNLCSGIILGYSFQKQHKNLIIQYDGNRED